MIKNNYSKISNKFINDNEWVLHYVLGQYQWLDDYEDLLQEARIWIMEAKYKWKKKRSSWNTFVCKYVRWKYNLYVNSKKLLKNNPESSGYKTISLDQMMIVHSGSSIFNNVDQQIGLKDEKYDLDEITENKLLYEKALSYLPEDRNKEIMKMILLGYKHFEVGRKFGISSARIGQIYHRQLDIIRNYLKENK
jgi:RNA polymerase sigma factor (sigma-70 family)